jgi:hypothetical protein
LLRLAGVYVVVLAVLRLTLAAPEGCDEPPAARLRDTASRAGSWLADSQRADDRYAYTVARDGTDIGGYNEVRHAGVMLSLYQVGELEAADRGLDWALDHLEPVGDEDSLALTLNGRASVGGAALLTAALVERRLQTGDESHDDDLRALGRFLVSMQRADGGFVVSVNPATGERDLEGTSRYYPGEALWALARLHSLFPDEGWDEPAELAAEFIATERDDVEGVVAPPLNDHWAAYGFAEMATWGPVSDAVADYARLLYGRFALLIRTESKRDAALLNVLHGPARRSAALGTWVEGQAALGRLAARDDRLADLEDRIETSARCGTGVLVDRQESDGAWYARGETRMDDQQHAISGLLAVAEW